MISRTIETIISQNINTQKVSLLLGARRVGKTALLQSIKNKKGNACFWLNGEDEDVHKLLENRSVANYKRILQGFNLLIIDEAQFIPDIGRKAKLMIDEIQPLHIILTGPSAFHIQQTGEPLTGRTITYHLYPIAQMELQMLDPLQTKQHLEERLIFGSYTEVITMTTLQQKQQYLTELMNTYLLKDILTFENIKNSQKLKDLMKLLAYQIGSEVSTEELGRQLGISKNTVDRYLDLLTKVFVIYKRGGYSKNLRKEIVKSQRWYFFDNGIRNALINNFSLLPARQDVGQLWENYILAERIKKNSYNQNEVNSYFWRTYDQQEIDLVEEKDSLLNAYEMKWKNQHVKKPVAFSKAYTDAGFEVIHQDNYLEWIT
jgi:predicted AAA+ superfamily ATPase